MKFQEGEGKFLGVVLDERLNFRCHIDYVSVKVSKALGVLYKLQNYVSEKGLVNLYYSLVYPHLTYCNLSWGGTSVTHLNPLIVLQKRAIRIITKIGYRDHTNLKFYESRILKMHDIHKLQLAVFLFNVDLSPYQRNHSHDTRNRTALNPFFNRLTSSQRSLTYSSPMFWNNLPAHVTNVQSLIVFKRRVKDFLLNFYLNEQLDIPN